MAKEQKEKLITAVVTFITTVLSILFLQACTMLIKLRLMNWDYKSAVVIKIILFQ